MASLTGLHPSVPLHASPFIALAFHLNDTSSSSSSEPSSPTDSSCSSGPSSPQPYLSSSSACSSPVHPSSGTSSSPSSPGDASFPASLTHTFAIPLSLSAPDVSCVLLPKPKLPEGYALQAPRPAPSRPSSPSEDAPKRSRQTSTVGLRKSPNKWTKEENQKLSQLVTLYGEKKWKRISAEMGGQKTGAQCAQHWKRVLSPEIRKGPWDEDEEALLLRLVAQHGSCWKKIAKKISKRTDIQCRYQYLKARQSREAKWTPKEDEVLLRRIAEVSTGPFNWLEVSEYMAKLKSTSTLRTALECKQHYEIITGVVLHSTSHPAAPVQSGDFEGDDDLGDDDEDFEESGPSPAPISKRSSPREDARQSSKRVCVAPSSSEVSTSSFAFYNSVRGNIQLPPLLPTFVGRPVSGVDAFSARPLPPSAPLLRLPGSSSTYSALHHGSVMQSTFLGNSGNVSVAQQTFDEGSSNGGRIYSGSEAMSEQFAAESLVFLAAISASRQSNAACF
eukprot:TRINITY_DN845_c0_g1_i3.p1 TRINITY_DN845_c0_g1~~TRINITY_DN845_c0_g1_i3.p1  ORF type:complete len:503 (-),score=149.73 TRINITY_DN845_c0_g1_i3:457-1965(-)